MILRGGVRRECLVAMQGAGFRERVHLLCASATRGVKRKLVQEQDSVAPSVLVRSWRSARSREILVGQRHPSEQLTARCFVRSFLPADACSTRSSSVF
ncbi:unnamed protein product [Heligmosomoides polygyrus]|uniref:Uncharacterized protein n=1 Tax=Heligmosomoides polygyrus TaxID=6339 RepID=A0A183FP13_HELPZ|nr:unnamed protein product [Heligmosomoides polygyrus]